MMKQLQFACAVFFLSLFGNSLLTAQQLAWQPVEGQLGFYALDLKRIAISENQEMLVVGVKEHSLFVDGQLVLPQISSDSLSLRPFFGHSLKLRIDAERNPPTMLYKEGAYLADDLYPLMPMARSDWPVLLGVFILFALGMYFHNYHIPFYRTFLIVPGRDLEQWEPNFLHFLFVALMFSFSMGLYFQSFYMIPQVLDPWLGLSLSVSIWVVIVSFALPFLQVGLGIYYAGLSNKNPVPVSQHFKFSLLIYLGMSLLLVLMLLTQEVEAFSAFGESLSDHFLVALMGFKAILLLILLNSWFPFKNVFRFSYFCATEIIPVLIWYRLLMSS